MNPQSTNLPINPTLLDLLNFDIETASPEDVEKIVKAFRELRANPAKRRAHIKKDSDQAAGRKPKAGDITSLIK